MVPLLLSNNFVPGKGFQGPKKAYVTFLWSKTTLILLVLVMSNKSTSSIYVIKFKKSIVEKKIHILVDFDPTSTSL